MAKTNTNVIAGLILIVIGAFFLLHELGQIYIDGELITSLLLLGLGVVALVTYFKDRATWKLIAGVFLTVFGVFFYAEYHGWIYGNITGAFFLWAMATGFISVYAANRDNWWALIPGGVLTTLGFVVIVEEMWFAGEFVPVVLFGGFSLTFWLLFFLKNEKHKLGWAAWPATFLGLFAIMLWGERFFWNFGELFWPSALICVGGILIYRSIKKEKEQNAQLNS